MQAPWVPVVIAVADAETATGSANDRLIWAGLALVGALLVGAAALALTDRWRKKMCGPASDLDRESAFRISYERGELSEDEYRRVRAALAGGPKTANPPPPSEAQNAGGDRASARPPDAD